VILALGIGVPPSSHFIYIPVMFILGIVIVFILGSKATRDALAFEQRKAAEREERKARRQATSSASSSSAADSPK
jgi:arginine exporter protein ArgO